MRYRGLFYENYLSFKYICLMRKRKRVGEFNFNRKWNSEEGSSWLDIFENQTSIYKEMRNLDYSFTPPPIPSNFLLILIHLLYVLLRSSNRHQLVVVEDSETRLNFGRRIEKVEWRKGVTKKKSNWENTRERV